MGIPKDKGTLRGICDRLGKKGTAEYGYPGISPQVDSHYTIRDPGDV